MQVLQEKKNVLAQYFCSPLAMSWLKCLIRKELEELVSIQTKPTKMLKGLEIVSFAARLKEELNSSI